VAGGSIKEEEEEEEEIICLFLIPMYSTVLSAMLCFSSTSYHRTTETPNVCNVYNILNNYQ
jgi:hypothetical protein